MVPWEATTRRVGLTNQSHMLGSMTLYCCILMVEGLSLTNVRTTAGRDTGI